MEEIKYKFKNHVDNDWIRIGQFLVNKYNQGTSKWLDARKGRLTASNFGSALGLTPYTSPEEIADNILGTNKVEKEVNYNMIRGTKLEPLVRDWYAKTKNKKVEQIGLAVPIWDMRIGASPDGIILEENGMIEIKCPNKMYDLLSEHIGKLNNGFTHDKFYHSHIYDSHYCQMQGCMKILEKDWCDYIVYDDTSKKIYTERIYYNENYWNNTLYPGITKFLNMVDSKR